ncbi:hypothetical protein [Geitlerinema sp. PCC 9228]|jgi:hypothetical protein|uniref:hypothetical protein n=1 Tax=Geitlerinema sp. PCC 9228 TaxID=111611 RepID=UPI0008F9BF18|nr:hypothetical protein [Geitlerinema sp. PCC 9228]
MKFLPNLMETLPIIFLLFQIGIIPVRAQENNLSWTTIFNREEPGESEGDTPLVNRGDICAIAPRNEIWHQQPVFVWQGELVKVEVQPRNRRDTVLWSQPVTPDDSHVVYDGDPLQPGKAYDWVAFLGENAVLEVPFQVSPYATRAQHWGNVRDLETKLQQQGANANEIALHRAQYFQQQGWRSDVIQEAFSVANPSEELQQVRRRWQTSICSPRSQSNE